MGRGGRYRNANVLPCDVYGMILQYILSTRLNYVIGAVIRGLGPSLFVMLV